MPEAKPLTWKYTAAAGTHMVVFCNCVNEMCVVPDEFHEVLAGQDGRVDKSQLMFHSPAFARAIEKGWNCKKLDWRVPFVWPSLVQFLQESRNVTARVCISETEPQTLFKIVNEISRRSAQHPDENVDYSLVKRAVIRSAPPCAGYVDDMIKLAKVFLNDGNDLKDLDAFQKACQYTSRQLGAKFFLCLGTGSHRWELNQWSEVPHWVVLCCVSEPPRQRDARQHLLCDLASRHIQVRRHIAKFHNPKV